MSRVGWIDASFGASGDMLLGALAGAGADVAGPVAALGLDVDVQLEPARRGGLAATRARVRVGTTPQPVRTLAEVSALLGSAALPAAVVERAGAVFRLLAEAEAAVHASTVEQVHFHEVGALDSLADVVGTVAGLAGLALDSLTCSPVAVGSGSVRSEHGPLPVPGPAVLELLRRGSVPTAPQPYPDAGELLTPTAAALLAVCAAGFGPMPPLAVDAVGVGAGERDPAAGPNVTRLVLGRPVPAPGPPGAQPGPAEPVGESAADRAAGAGLRLLECTVDDLDPRVWPSALEALLAAGALDCWLTPVLMKKGRPGHLLTALVPPEALAAVRAAMLAETTTLGLREIALAHRPALERRFATVLVAGHRVAVKLGLAADGSVLTATPEWEDVAAVSRALGQPARQVLARAAAAAAELLG